MAQTVKSVLFFDYDSICQSLSNRYLDAGATFTRLANAWVSGIESGELISSGASEPRRRRLLVKRCYADPRMLGDNRAGLIAGGIQIVDCPTQIGRPRNAADISMALDTIDALEHATGFEEFILLSAGSDLSPVLFRLRAHARASVVYADAAVTESYLASADGAIAEADLARILGLSLAPLALAPPRREQVQLPRPVPTPESLPTIALPAIPARAGVTSEAASSDSRPPAPAPAAEFVAADTGAATPPPPPRPIAPPQETTAQREVGGLREDRARESNREELAALVRRMHQSTRVPLFSPRSFADLFRILAAEVSRNGYRFQVTAENVTNEMIAGGRNVTRRQVGFVVKGLALKGHNFSDRDTPDDLAALFREQVLYLARNANLNLTDREIELVSMWIGGRGSPDKVARPAPPSQVRIESSVAPPPRPAAAPPAPERTPAPTPPPRDVPPPSAARPRAEKRGPRRLAEVPMPPRIVLPPIVPDAGLRPAEPLAPTGPIAPRRPPAKPPAPSPQPPPVAERTDLAIARQRTVAAPEPAPSMIPRPPRPPRPRDAPKRIAAEEAPRPPAPAPAATPVAASPPAPADDMESMILAAIAEAVEVKPTTAEEIEFHFDLNDAPPETALPPETSEPGSDIGEEIQRILASYGQNRSSRGKGA